MRRRIQLAVQCVVACLLWLAETWHPTVCQIHQLDSWGARLAARVARVRPHADEGAPGFWRRMHREGHHLMRRSGGSINVRRRRMLHQFAGHLARVGVGPLRDALRTRCLAWWRFQQGERAEERHPKRFRAWRSEDQLEQYYGEGATADSNVNVGWMLVAQDRELWKSWEANYTGA